MPSHYVIVGSLHCWLVAFPNSYGGTYSAFLWRIIVRDAQHFCGIFQNMYPQGSIIGSMIKEV